MFNHSDHWKVRSARRWSVAVLVLAIAASPASAEEDEPSATEEFMSDRGRVGAVVGSILAGAAIANPFASLAGNIIGFVVGKTSDFTDDGEAGENTVKANGWRRSIAPAVSESSSSGEGAVVPTLAMATPEVNLALPAADGANGEAEETSIGDDPVEVSAPSSAEKELAGNDEVVSSEELSPQSGSPEGGAPEVAIVAEEKDVDAATEPKGEDRGEELNLVITKDVGGRQAQLEKLAATIRSEQGREHFEPHPSCPSREVPKYRKKVAVAAFALETPRQGAFGSLFHAGESVSETLYQKFRESGNVAPYFAPTRQMFASLDMAPTSFAPGNRLNKYSAVSREMGVQFVVSGVIRNLDVSDAETWNTSYASNAKRALFGGDHERAFTVDVVVHDGFSGHVVHEQRYSEVGRWEFSRRDKVRFGSDRFTETHYGQMVSETLSRIADDVVSKLACQPMLVPILDVDGKDLVLDIGTESGLLPGTYMEVVRKEHALHDPDRPPQLWETGVKLHIHSLSLDSARAWMPEYGGVINIRPGDYAVLY